MAAPEARGIYPKFWGPCGWDVLQATAANCHDYDSFQDFVELEYILSYILCCSECSKHFSKMLGTIQPVYTDEHSAYNFIYTQHSTVNNRLGKLNIDYNTAYNLTMEKNVDNSLWMLLACLAFSLENICGKQTLCNGRSKSFRDIFADFCALLTKLLGKFNNSSCSCIAEFIPELRKTPIGLFDWVKKSKLKCTGYNLDPDSLFLSNCPDCVGS